MDASSLEKIKVKLAGWGFDQRGLVGGVPALTRSPQAFDAGVSAPRGDPWLCCILP